MAKFRTRGNLTEEEDKLLTGIIIIGIPLYRRDIPKVKDKEKKRILIKRYLYLKNEMVRLFCKRDGSTNYLGRIPKVMECPP
jgi:hypothetical protein